MQPKILIVLTSYATLGNTGTYTGFYLPEVTHPEALMVSYWRSEDSLRQFFRSEHHKQMMQFIAKNPNSLCLYNETYTPSYSGKYINEPQGMAMLVKPLQHNLQAH